MAKLSLLIFYLSLFISRNTIEGNVGFRNFDSYYSDEDGITDLNFENEYIQDYYEDTNTGGSLIQHLINLTPYFAV